MKNKVLPFLIVSVLSYSFIHFTNRTNNYSLRKSIEVKQESNEFPKAVGFVNDFEEIIDSVVEIELNQLILSHRVKTSNQIAIVSLNNIGDYTDFNLYSLDLAIQWGVGEKEKNNGILIAFSKKYRKIRINVGDGLLDKLTNEETKFIIDQIAIPNFKQEAYSKGIDLCLRELIKELEK